MIVTEDDPLNKRNNSTKQQLDQQFLNNPRISISNSLTDVNDDLKVSSANEIGRVTKWAIGFEKLLEDEIGLEIFTVIYFNLNANKNFSFIFFFISKEFLKKEISQENIEFWVKCEKFKKIDNENEVKKSIEIGLSN